MYHDEDVPEMGPPSGMMAEGKGVCKLKTSYLVHPFKNCLTVFKTGRIRAIDIKRMSPRKI